MFADADLDAAVDGAMMAKMRNMGEACTAANRFLVHRSVADAFADRLAERMAALPVGRGTDDGVEVGPLIDAKGREKVVDELVDDAVARRRGPGRRRAGRRARLLLPADRADRRALDARLTKEEIFGPVAPISVFDDRGRGGRRGQRHRVRPGQLRVHRERRPGAAGQRALEAGMVGLNTGWSRTRPRRSAGSSSPGSAARAARWASRSTWRPSTSPSA